MQKKTAKTNRKTDTPLRAFKFHKRNSRHHSVTIILIQQNSSAH